MINLVFSPQKNNSYIPSFLYFFYYFSIQNMLSFVYFVVIIIRIRKEL
jgi:hypothetical protein